MDAVPLTYLAQSGQVYKSPPRTGKQAVVTQSHRPRWCSPKLLRTGRQADNSYSIRSSYDHFRLLTRTSAHPATERARRARGPNTCVSDQSFATRLPRKHRGEGHSGSVAGVCYCGATAAIAVIPARVSPPFGAQTKCRDTTRDETEPQRSTMGPSGTSAAGGRGRGGRDREIGRDKRVGLRSVLNPHLCPQGITASDRLPALLLLTESTSDTSTFLHSDEPHRQQGDWGGGVRQFTLKPPGRQFYDALVSQSPLCPAAAGKRSCAAGQEEVSGGLYSHAELQIGFKREGSRAADHR
ncbi:hypothetical protein GN956_G13795 [Arapaima gigas]